MRPARGLMLAVVLIVIAGACTGGSEEVGGTTTETSPISTSEEDLPGEIAEELEADLAALPVGISVEPAVVAPGETIAVGGLDGAVGILALHAPDGSTSERAVTGPRMSVDIPVDAAAGRYLLVAESADGLPAAAGFRVADGPFIVLAFDRGGLFVEASGVPADTPAGLMVGSGDEAEFFEAGPGGVLLPVSREPTATLQDYIDVRLVLPPGVEGSVTLIGEAETGFRSNTVALGRCEIPPVLVGDLGGPGEVRAVWTGSRPGSAAVETETGAYRVETGPGLVALTEFPAAGEQRTFSATVGCGVERNVAEDGAVSDSFSAAELTDDSWIGSVTGAEEIDVTAGVALCTPDGDGLELSLFDDLDFSIGLVATVDGLIGDGFYQVPGFVLGGEGEFAEGTFSLEVEQTGDGRLLGTFSGSATTDAGGIEFAGAFRCAFEHPQGQGDASGVEVSYQSGGGHEKCRIGYVQVPDVGSEVARVLARRLAAGLPVVEWYTSEDIKGFLAAAAQEQLAGGDGSDAMEAAQRAINADFYVPVRIREFPGATGDRRFWAILKAIDVERSIVVARAASSGPTVESLKIIPNSGAFITAIGRSGICGYADPLESTISRGEKQEFSYEVVDLTDSPVLAAQASVADRRDGSFSPECGSFDRLAGTTGDAFETTFTAPENVDQDCTEYPRFSATLGDLETHAEREQGDATIHVGSKWEYFATLTYPTPDGDIVWRSGSPAEPGVFYVRESGTIIGGAVGTADGVRSCEVHENDVLTFKEPITPIGGTWLSYLGGKFVDEEYFEFRFSGRNWDGSWPPLPPECKILFFAEDALRIIAFNLDRITVNPVRFTPEPDTVTFAIDPEALPGAEFVMTIRPAAPDGE